MKFFVSFAFLLAAAMTFVAASPASNSGVSGSSNVGVGSSGGSVAGVSVNQDAAESELQQAAQPVAIQSAVDFSRFRKSAGYGASIPSPPCPKNYLFSCQPNLSPIACSAPAPSYGSQGAYSAPIPAYVTPFRGNFGVPQGIGYNTNQYYQY